jgi:curli production assembly/transport component CsgE
LLIRAFLRAKKKKKGRNKLLDKTRSVVLAALWLVCVPASAEPDLAQSPAQGPSQGQSQSTDPSEALNKANQSLQADTDGGVVTNQVITVAGQDFYQHFVNAWRDKDGSERYTLAIHERPSARWGSEIWIEFAQRRVFRTYLPPARAAIKPISEEAANITYQAVLQADVQRQLIHDADLGRDEI